MPLIKPEVQKVLKEAGLLSSKTSTSVIEQLNDAGLTDESIAEGLSELANSRNETLRLRALETALKVKGALKDTPPVVPSFTVVIQNSSHDLSKTEGVNPILFPRQSFKSSEKEKDTN